MPPRIKIKLPPKAPFAKIGIAGLGLIGGSLAKALMPLAGLRLYAFDNDARTLDEAQRSRQFVRVTADREEFASWPLDLGYLCLPVAHNVKMVNFLAYYGARFPLTDAGSTKTPVTEAALKAGLLFCGGHPIAGREVSGYKHATADLIKGCLLVLTPDDRFGPEVHDLCTKLSNLHSILDCRIKILSPQEHDKVYSLVSHLTQLTASSLAGTVCRLGGEEALNWAGSGFRDTTRVAASEPAKWAEIFLDNADNLVEDLSTIIDILSNFKDILSQRDNKRLMECLTEYSTFRRKLPDING